VFGPEAEAARTAQGRARLELESGAARGRGTRQACPACQRERERRGKRARLWAEGKGWWAARAGREKEGEGGPRPAGPWGKERRVKREAVGRAVGGGREGKKGRGRWAGWAGLKEEKREKNKANAFEFENET
jgi:hypothetical protein